MSGSGSDDGFVEDAKALIRALGPVADELRAFGALARQKGGVAPAIFFLITSYILAGIFNVINVIAGSVLFAFDFLVGALTVAQIMLVGAFGGVGRDILSTAVSVQQAFADVLVGAGPLAPIIAVAVAAGALYLVSRVGVVLLGELPIGSSIVDLLGLR